MNKFVMRQSLLLLLTATIWGVAFVAQSVGMDYIGPFTFNVVRNVIGGLVLIPCIAVFHRTGAKEEDAGKTPGSRKNLLLGGICCGVMLFVAGNLQQIGIQYTTVGKAGFITAMYIVLVPILSIFLGKKAGIKIWAAVALAVAGLYILCMTDGSFSLQKGDLFVLLSAFAFSAHILVIDHFAPLADGVKMSCIQFFVCALLSAVCMWLFEKPDMETFYGLKLAYEAGRTGGSLPTVLNAANERAVAMFLDRKIKYLQIPEIIQACMEAHKNIPSPTVEEILKTEQATYEFIKNRW